MRIGYKASNPTVSQFQLKGRYARQYLSFAGKSSKDFLLYLSDPGVYDSPAADVESTPVPGRNGDTSVNNTTEEKHVNGIFRISTFAIEPSFSSTRISRSRSEVDGSMLSSFDRIH